MVFYMSCVDMLLSHDQFTSFRPIFTARFGNLPVVSVCVCVSLSEMISSHRSPPRLEVFTSNSDGTKTSVEGGITSLPPYSLQFIVLSYFQLVAPLTKAPKTRSVGRASFRGRAGTHTHKRYDTLLREDREDLADEFVFTSPTW